MKSLPIAQDTPRHRVEPRASLKIGDLAKRAGKSTRAVRLYEELGLLVPEVRTEGGHRLYSEVSLDRLLWIDKLGRLGFKLDEIRIFLEQLECGHSAPAAMENVRAIFASKLESIQTQIKELNSLVGELQDSLAYLETCSDCAPSTLFGACRACDQEHPVEPPALITGIHVGGDGKTQE